MATFRFERVRLLLAEQHPGLRKTLTDSLFAAGFKTVIDTAEAEEIERFVRAGSVDVLICDHQIKGGSLAGIVQEIRHNRLGRNPFLVVVALMETPDATSVREVVNAGVDDVLIKPFGMDMLLTRIKALARSRKPFIVTHDYIGPDRRKEPRPGPQVYPLIDVPNPLQCKALSNTDALTLQRMIDSATARINAEKSDRYVEELEELVPRLRQAFDDNFSLEGMEAALRRLDAIANDLSMRLRRSVNAHVAEVALSLSTICERLIANPAVPHERDMELLGKVVLVMGRAFNRDSGVLPESMEIANRVGDYAEAQQAAAQ